MTITGPYYEIDYTVSLRPDFLRDWSKRAACHGKWELMDSVRREAARVCMGCPVRMECLADAMEFEDGNGYTADIHNDLDRFYATNDLRERTGTRGGYKPSERQYISFAIELGASVYDF